jgi:polyisoprenoid-binding protein YceI
MKSSNVLRLTVLALAGLSISSLALAQQKLLAAQSELTFVSKQMGVPVEGHFKKFDAQIAFDPAKPDAAKIALNIDTGSATLGVPESDAELPKATWFSVAKFPQANFQSTTIKALGAGKFQIAGKLTIKGNTKDLEFPVALTQTAGVTTAAGQFVIKRLPFKIGENEWADTSMVADDVQVKFKLVLSGVNKI